MTDRKLLDADKVVEVVDLSGEEVAVAHGFTRQQFRAAKAIEYRIFGPYQWQNQGDRAASMMVQICQALKDQADSLPSQGVIIPLPDQD